MAPSFSRVSSGALLLALAYHARPVNADFWEDVDNCKLVLDDLPTDLTTDFCHDWTYGYQPEDDYVTVTGYPVTVTEYPDAKTCDGEGYSTTTKYPESTKASKPTKIPNESTKAPGETTKVPGETTKVPGETTKVPGETTKVPGETTKAPDQPSATGVPGSYDVTVTSTSWTTYWTTSTIYEGYPTATPAPYRRALNERAAWCVDRPCRLVQYDDDTIVEACKKYLGWYPHTSTVTVPGYTVTIKSYPTDCKKKDEGYKPDPYPTKTPDYPEEPAPYPEDKPGYGSGPSYGDEDYDDSDAKQPWQNDFDNNYSGPDGPLPWDDVDQTSELADAIDGGDYDSAAQKLGLDDAPWNALPVDFPQKRDEPSVDSYGSEDDYDVVWVDESGYPIDEEDYPIEDDKESYEPAEDSYQPDVDEESYEPAEDSYQPDVDEESYEPAEDSYQEDDSYGSEPSEPEYAPNVYGPDVPESDDYDNAGDYEGSGDYQEYSDESEPTYELPDSSEYEGDEFESDLSLLAEEPSAGPDSDFGNDGLVF